MKPIEQRQRLRKGEEEETHFRSNIAAAAAAAAVTAVAVAVAALLLITACAVARPPARGSASKATFAVPKEKKKQTATTTKDFAANTQSIRPASTQGNAPLAAFRRSVLATEVWKPLGPGPIDGVGDDNSGFSVSLSRSGDTVAVGSTEHWPGQLAGRVRVYRLVAGEGWVQMGGDIAGQADGWYYSGEALGYSVSLSSDGNRVAAGAPYLDSFGSVSSGPSSTITGRARVYRFLPGGTGGIVGLRQGSWQQVGGDIVEGNVVDDGAGASVSLSSDGDVVAVGAPDGIGNVRVYRLDAAGETWTPWGQTIFGDKASIGKEGFGNSVSLSSDGTRVAVGAPGLKRYAVDPGTVRVYDAPAQLSGPWVQVGGDIVGTEYGDGFGMAVALSGDGGTVASGAVGSWADGKGLNTGRVNVRRLVAGAWAWLGGNNGNIDGAAAGDQFGWSVALSDDGSRVAAGAPFHDDGSGGADVGHVRAYELAPGSSLWSQLPPDLDGDGPRVNETGGWLGWSVAVSGDGKRIAAGAPIRADSSYGNIIRAGIVGRVRLYYDARTPQVPQRPRPKKEKQQQEEAKAKVQATGTDLFKQPAVLRQRQTGPAQSLHQEEVQADSPQECQEEEEGDGDAQVQILRTGMPDQPEVLRQRPKGGAQPLRPEEVRQVQVQRRPVPIGGGLLPQAVPCKEVCALMWLDRRPDWTTNLLPGMAAVHGSCTDARRAQNGGKLCELENTKHPGSECYCAAGDWLKWIHLFYTKE